MDLVYCGKCKAKTQTDDFEIVDYEISRTKKSGDVSTNPRKVIKGVCTICKTKKHLFTGKDKERFEQD